MNKLWIKILISLISLFLLTLMINSIYYIASRSYQKHQVHQKHIELIDTISIDSSLRYDAVGDSMRFNSIDPIDQFKSYEDTIKKERVYFDNRYRQSSEEIREDIERGKRWEYSMEHNVLIDEQRGLTVLLPKVGTVKFNLAISPEFITKTYPNTDYWIFIGKANNALVWVNGKQSHNMEGLFYYYRHVDEK